VLLFLAVAIPWLSLMALGTLWLWQSGLAWVWAAAAAVLGLLVWPLSRSVQRRANQDARIALGDLAHPSREWNIAERHAWTEVIAIADATPAFAFTDTGPILDSARMIVEAVARHFHPDAHAAWAQFNLPEFLLLLERLSRDTRRQALRYIPAVRAMRLSHLLWVQRQKELYGGIAQTGWRLGFGLWRIIRAALNPLQATGQETSGIFAGKAVGALSYRFRAHVTRLLLLEIGRAAIDLYAGRLALSEEDMRAAQASDQAVAIDSIAPVRIVLMGQVNAGKSSLLNALAQEVRSAIGPLPVTSGIAEHLLEVEGRPRVMLVDTPGFDESPASTSELRAQAKRADLIIWVASATQPARSPDRQQLDDFRAWADVQLARRPPSVLLALTHIDELRPAAEWAPPYDVISPQTPKARAIRAAIHSVADALGLRADAVVPVAMRPGQQPYNIDALWARIALEIDEARLVQLDRLRVGQQRLNLLELADQLGRAGRTVIKGIVRA